MGDCRADDALIRSLCYHSVRERLAGSPGGRIPLEDHALTLDPQSGATAQIPLYRYGEAAAYATVDADDFSWLNAYRWLYHPNGSGYAFMGRGKNRQFMHRLILGLPPRRTDDREADHRNRDGLDNRRCNLRIVTRAQNNQNRPAYRNGKSHYRGVSRVVSNGRWRADVKLNGKTHTAGCFADELQAAEAAKALRLQLMPYTVESVA